ncbi:T9SS type B sorting domain-containing protein [Winogradskyella ursingii]|uniref:T9SS type B sorting domain-containing protein n=1 Tax=Winogradskyella ursingii TaxID=2686079 RepID=UPI001C53F7F4|nr:T9SS type B sorting domain-containing protein [Winogradskyella ursingii]
MLSNIGFAQNEANIWYFGNNAGLDFNSGSPVVLTDGQLATLEGCSTISDSDGNLLFYSDGITVWNKNHSVMVNGTGLKGHPSSTHSALIVPKPNDPNIYYIFTVDEASSPANGIQYSEVDMTLEGGLGAITSNKNILLHTPTTEKLTAIKNFAGSGYWVLSHEYNSNNFMAYEVTATGVNATPVISSVGTIVAELQSSRGQIKISPNGTKVAVARSGDLEHIELYDFNNSTGIVSNPLLLFTDNYHNPYGIEFSPNSKLLYSSMSQGQIYQFNLDAGTDMDIIDSRIILSNNFGTQYAGMQLGPDGKIYVATYNSEYLDAINDPNIVGTGCNYVTDAIYLDGRESQLGLPPFIQSFFFVGFQANTVCQGDATDFNANISQSYDTLIWDFGDGNSSTEENPSHTYLNHGDYEVTLTVTSGAQSSVDTKTITVYETPTVTPVVELRQCDDDLDGFSIFNLNEANAEISVNHLNETITYYESHIDAENEVDAINNITDYPNEVVSLDTVWARVENIDGCYAISQVNLVVSTTQIPNTFTREFYQCDDGANTTDGIASFDFSSVNSEIEAMFPSGQQLSVTYFRNLSDALSEINAIDDISNYQNMGYPNNQDIYVRVDSELDNDCLGLGHHITLNVEKVPIANPVLIDQQCDADGDGLYDFDTSDIETEILDGQNNVTVEYYDALGNALPSPLPDPFSTSTQDVIARVINSTSKDPDGACYDETTLSFVVDAAAVAYPMSDFLECDNNNDGSVSFDTSNIESLVLNGQSGMSVSYFDENGNTLPSPLPDPFTSESQTITIRVENVLSTSCYDETTVNFVVTQQPVANAITDDFVCDDVSNDGEHIFVLSEYDEQMLNGQSSSQFEIRYFETIDKAENNIDALPNVLTVNSTSQTIFARIHNIDNHHCYEITSFELGVNYMPLAYQPDNLYICDDAENDGVEMFDLSVQSDAILNGQSPTDGEISFHLNFEDAEIGQEPQSLDFVNTSNPQTLFARIQNNNNKDCYSITSFDLIVNEQPVLLMNDLWPICEGSDVQIIADEGYDNYSWSSGETTRVITVDEPGQYTVTASNTYGNLICSVEKTITVSISDIAIITDIETVDWSQTDNVISVFIEGNGDYEYSIDGINYQDESIFDRLPIDEYTVYVRDKNGCGIVTQDVYLLNYPRYFTPNGDGTNDFWQIKNSAREPLNKLSIYDRYGKLIKQLQPSDFGWDGTLNGNKLPSNDYWFVLERQNGKTYTGHFTLKR